jgi:hypothetical protein
MNIKNISGGLKMKKRFILCVAVMFICAAFATQVFAQIGASSTFDVTGDYGIIVQEKGTCEKVGGITISPKKVGGDNPDIFLANTDIKVELLANAEVCAQERIFQYYKWNGAVTDDTTTPPSPVTEANADYILEIPPTPSTSFFIHIKNPSVGNDQIRIGHLRESPICFNLLNTPYRSDDPNYQYVQVSFKSSSQDTPDIYSFTSDTYVATVKPKATYDIVVCPKKEVEPIPIAGWPGNVNKNGIVEIPLCCNVDTQGQEQQTCGCCQGPQVCFIVKDPSSSLTADTYIFDVSTSKTGVGIARVDVYGKSPGFAPIGAAITQRFDISGNTIFGPPQQGVAPVWLGGRTGNCNNNVETKRITFTAQLTGTGPYYVVLTSAYNTCPDQAVPGDWLANISFTKFPCGGSFSKQNVLLAKFTQCQGLPALTRVFPYMTRFLPDTGWWNGLVLTNPNNVQNEVTLNIYEDDGDAYTTSITIPANGLQIRLMSDITPQLVQGQTDSGATFGDEDFWMIGESTLPFYGVLIIGNGTQSTYGYLPFDPTEY